MRNFLQSLNYRFARFMQGRYGKDSLSAFLDFIGFGLLLVSLLLSNSRLYFIGAFLILLSGLRILSKNHEARRKELFLYNRITKKPRELIQLLAFKLKYRKTHCCYRCHCGQLLRVPRGKGKIEIRCSKCGERFIRKT